VQLLTTWVDGRVKKTPFQGAQQASLLKAKSGRYTELIAGSFYVLCIRFYVNRKSKIYSFLTHPYVLQNLHEHQ
jgi:hypothetical protein